MKKRILVTFAATMIAAGSGTAYADKVQFDQLPQAIRDAIRAYAGASQIEDIDREVRDGQTVYEVAFKRNGQHTEMRLNSNGDLLNPEVVGRPGSPVTSGALTSTSTVPPTPLTNARKVELTQVPAVVQNAIRSHSAGNRIEDIDVGTLNGRRVYEAGFKRNGQHTELRVAEDGTLLGMHVPDATGSIASDPLQTTAQSGQANAQGGRRADRHLASLPTSVQRAFLNHAGTGARIRDIDEDQENGRTLYEIEYVQNGQRQEVEIYGDGTLSNAGQSGSRIETGTQSQTVSSNDPISTHNSRYLQNLPAGVQETFRRHVVNGRITDIDRKRKADGTYYEINFVPQGLDEDDEQEIHIFENGTLRGNAPGQSVTANTGSATPRVQTQTDNQGRPPLGVNQFETQNRRYLQNLPAPVQDTFRRYVTDGRIVDVDSKRREDGTYYEVKFIRAGRDRDDEQEIHIYDNGKIRGAAPQ